MAAQLILAPNREKSLLRKHPWVFASAVERINGKVRLGDTVDILDSQGTFLAKAAYSPESQIRARVWSFNPEEVIDNGFFQRKLEQALLLRQSIITKHGLTGYRLVAGESDNLPGVTIDRYDNVLVCQLLSAGAEKHRNKIVWALKTRFPECSILERSDVSVRNKEGLAPLVQVLHGNVPEEVIIEENGIKILVDLKHGHKTGFYLDQRDNRQIAAQYATGKTVLNCFSYTGTFGSYAMKAGAKTVINLDVSDNALETAKRNLIINDVDPQTCSFINKDVFTALREYRDANQKFDQIILDPPKFVDSKASLNRACRGYKDINMLAMQLLKPGGILCTFSCSGLLPSDLFQKVVADAALDANKQVHFLQRLGQAPDHPVASQYPEGFYLKGFVCRVA